MPIAYQKTFRSRSQSFESGLPASLFLGRHEFGGFLKDPNFVPKKDDNPKEAWALTSFPRFSLLPRRIQRQIWSVALRQPRIVEVNVHSAHGLNVSAIPPMLHACQESRAMAMSFYRGMRWPIFDRQDPNVDGGEGYLTPQTFFHPVYDTMLLRQGQVPDVYYERCIESIAITMENAAQVSMNPTASLASSFESAQMPNLKQLLVMAIKPSSAQQYSSNRSTDVDDIDEANTGPRVWYLSDISSTGSVGKLQVARLWEKAAMEYRGTADDMLPWSRGRDQFLLLPFFHEPFPNDFMNPQWGPLYVPRSEIQTPYNPSVYEALVGSMPGMVRPPPVFQDNGTILYYPTALSLALGWGHLWCALKYEWLIRCLIRTKTRHDWMVDRIAYGPSRFTHLELDEYPQLHRFTTPTGHTADFIPMMSLWQIDLFNWQPQWHVVCQTALAIDIRRAVIAVPADGEERPSNQAICSALI